MRSISSVVTPGFTAAAAKSKTSRVSWRDGAYLEKGERQQETYTADRASLFDLLGGEDLDLVVPSLALLAVGDAILGIVGTLDVLGDKAAWAWRPRAESTGEAVLRPGIVR